MKADNKHYKFINSQTGNALHYHSVNAGQKDDDTKAELEKIKAQVATKNGLFVGVVYWEEEKKAN